MKKVVYILLFNLLLLTGYTISEVANQFYIRCYVESMSSDPMGNTDLSQYTPEAVKHIDVYVVEYSDTDWWDGEKYYYTKDFETAKEEWQTAIENLNMVFADAKIEFSLADDNYQRKTIQTGAASGSLDYLFTDCSITPLNDIKMYPDKYLRISSMPLDVKVRYNETDYTVSGSVEKIFGSCIYINRNALGYDLQYYVAQSLGLYDTDETHFGTNVGDFLDDTEINEPDNLMNRQNPGTGLTPNQIQRLNWALETQPDLKKLIETEVEFANQINNEMVSGELFYDNHSVSSGETVNLLDSKQYEIGTQDQVINHNLKDYQHYRWNGKAEDYLIKRNTRIVKTSDKETKQHAEFAPLELINIDLPTEATFYLRDPWYLSNDQQLNEFREISGNNFRALIKQNENFYEQYPIYEIKQPPSHQRNVHNENIIYYFKEWTGTDVNYQDASNNQTEIVFEKSNASIQANYKGHLASDKARATGFNNGRRIFKDNNNTLYLVYEDNGNIWLTKSSDGGKTWCKEEKINLSDNCINPSIAGHNESGWIVFSWYAKDYSSIKFRYYETATNTWSTIYANDYLVLTGGPNIDPAPSIAETYVPGTIGPSEHTIYIAFNYEKLSETGNPTGISEVILQKGNFDNDLWQRSRNQNQPQRVQSNFLADYANHRR